MLQTTGLQYKYLEPVQTKAYVMLRALSLPEGAELASIRPAAGIACRIEFF